MLSCRFAEWTVRWTSRVLWVAVVSQSSENSSRQENRELPCWEQHTIPQVSPKSHQPLLKNTRLESDLSACRIWASNVGGEFPPAKTTQIRNYSNDHPIQLSSQPITIVKAAKHLGVHLTPDQSNTIHLQTILKTFQRRVNLLCFMGRHLAPTAFLLL